MLLSTLRNTTLGTSKPFIKEAFVDFKIIRRCLFTTMEVASQQRLDSIPDLLGSTKIKAPPPQLRRDKQQQAVKKKAVPYVPGIVNLQILGAGAGGAPSSVYLFTDQVRYLINCGEGTQRLAHEHKTKLARLEHIFVTRNTWSTIGGFPGLALTVQDAGVREMALHGPPHLDSILHSMKRFVVLKTLQVKTQDCTQETDFEDSVMTMKKIPIYHNASSEKVVIAYICKLKPRPGALNLEKCVEHGVPPGPLLGLLKNGIDVTLEDGTVIKSKDVSEPCEMALSFVFLDIPSEEYLPGLLAKAPVFHNATADPENEIALVIHFSPADVLQKPCYQNFMHNFPASAQHLYLNSEKNRFSGYIAAHRIQYQLNQLNERIFPLLGESEDLCEGVNISNRLKKTKLSESVEEQHEDSNDIADEKVSDASNTHLTHINSMTNFHLRPRKGLDRTLEAKLNPNEYINETQALSGFSELCAKVRVDVKALQENTLITSEYPKITFLGTGSCIPNKTRNVSSILVQPKENAYILLDCGEGTLGQIVRFFGRVKAEQVIQDLRAVYISHLHADHHIGLIALFNERQRLLTQRDGKKLLVLAPKQIEPWLNFYGERIDYIQNAYTLIGNAEMLEQPLALSETEHADMNIASIATCLVRHCPHSFGVSLTMESLDSASPVKITYSGDSMPCKDLVELGRDSTILIHEATMEDDLIEEAKVKMHSTISQAIAQGREMQAQHIILTHFSQRYAKLPRMQNMGEEAESQALQNVAIAFDNMQVTLTDLEHFHVLYPALRALFADHAEELEQKAMKRELKLERKRKLMNAY